MRGNSGPSLVTGGRRNKKYEAERKNQGLQKVTVWVPDEAAADLKNMAVFCCENRGVTPFMVREFRTGKLRKGV